ncbi:MAG: acyl-CoA dehydrogenase family protein [Chloroflexi bacterium]|nr:acyl-CoA dehydrogenase family protein [Chloroflexota bacterium]MDA1146528.1 acyl-CoA dehydrogenase family protein [Chloroflexota bacterium]
MVDFTDSPAEATFRAEVQAFLDETKPLRADGKDPGAFFGPKSVDADKMADYEAWRGALAAKHWVAPHWPKEAGGAGLSSREQAVLNEEFSKAGVSNVGGFGTMMIGPTLLVHGSDEQKAEHLPKIMNGEIAWCQGWSEPGAGSDLASLQTRAIRDGDEYVVNGQKIWTSGAHHADWMYMLARSDPDAPKHRGISFLMFPMADPGVTVRPLTQMTGHSDFNEVFFEDVHVPVANRVGEENRGWYVGMTLTDFERSGIGTSIGTHKSLRELLDRAKALPPEQSQLDKGEVRLGFADRTIDAEVSLLFSYHMMSMQAANRVPNYEASMAKMFGSEMNQRIARLHMKVYGLHAQIYDPTEDARTSTQPSYRYLRSMANTIEGGSSEIQRNIIATRGLGLPRG